MTRALSIGLVAFSLLVLGGSWLASKALTTDPAVPPVRLPEPPQPVAVMPVVPASPLSPAIRPAPMVEPQPAPIPAQRVEAPPVPAAEPVDPESTYASENAPEIEQAWKLVTGPDTGTGSWRNAQRIFQRCLVQVPSNQRCQQGLAAAEAKLGPELAKPVLNQRGPHRRLGRPGEEAE